MDETSFELEDRVLCSDDSCIGLVGPDGRCKVCGLVYTGQEPLPGAGRSPEERGRLHDEVSSKRPDPDPSSVEDSTEQYEDEERICCPDDMCTGIIGKDGKCGVCGKRP